MTNEQRISLVTHGFDEMPTVPKQDNINKPSHYHKNGIDVIGFAESQFSKEELKGFYRINAIKYLTRFDRKGSPIEDIDKAIYYANKLKEVSNG